MKIKNETEIQLMKILFKTSGKRPTRKMTSPRAYPHGIEMKYYRELKSFFKPLTDYVWGFIDQNMEPLLRGDSSETRLDTIPGDSFRGMIASLENWLSVYMPDISDLPEDSSGNIILTTLGKTADEAMEFGNKEFSKMLEKGIHVNLPTSAPWWDDMKKSWAEDNYSLITSNAKNYVSKINTLTEQAIVNGMSPAKLKEEIRKATESLSDKHCKLLARDQMGKLNGQITQAQMQEIGLDLYVWSTSADDRVRASHAAMEGLLCRWDDASVCSYDNGKTWVSRPSDAVDLHPGQDIQCRCVGLAFYPELVSEIEGEPMADVTDGLPPVQNLPEFKESGVGVPMPVKSIADLKKVNSPISLKEALKQTNPNFSTGKYEWQHNCQRCCPTYEAIRRGYDVVSKPVKAKNDIELNKDKFTDYNTNAFASMFKKPDVIEAKGFGKNEIKQAMTDWGDGSRCEICVVWKDGRAHVFMAEQVNGSTLFLDPQSNRVYDESVFNDVIKTYTKYFRIDNLDFNDNIIDCCLNRKEKRK